MNEAHISAEFPFEPRYVEVLGAKMHYVEAGTGDPILFLHGNPTSSYLWRNIIPHLTTRGRCIAPDLIGMGKSDKPDIAYRFFDHARYLEAFIEKLNLQNITLVIHDWGSALGFHYAMRHESNVKGIAFMEAVLKPSKWKGLPSGIKSFFKMCRTPVLGWYMIGWRNVFIEEGLPKSVVRPLTEAEMNHYRAPYLKRKHRLPLWRWPNEIPFDGKPRDVHDVMASYNQKLVASDLPKLLLYVTPGTILPQSQVEWCRQNLKNLTAVHLGKGYHFIQEDHPHAIGKAIAEWMDKHGLSGQ